MVFLQMFPIAVTCGNTFILKPSEKDPGDCDLLPHIVIYALDNYLISNYLKYVLDSLVHCISYDMTFKKICPSYGSL